MSLAFFEKLGFTGYCSSYVCRDPTSNIKYQASIPKSFRDVMGEQDNVKSFGWLNRCFDYPIEEMEALPQLPDELVFVVFKKPIEKTH